MHHCCQFAVVFIYLFVLFVLLFLWPVLVTLFLLFFYLEKVGSRCSNVACPAKAKLCLSHFEGEAEKFCTCSPHSIYLKKEKVCVGKCYTFMFNTGATRSTADRLAKLTEVAGSKPRPDQHSGSLNNWGENAVIVMISANVKLYSLLGLRTINHTPRLSTLQCSLFCGT